MLRLACLHQTGFIASEREKSSCYQNKRNRRFLVCVKTPAWLSETFYVCCKQCIEMDDKLKILLLTELSFFHLCMRPRIPDVTDNSPSDGGFQWESIHVVSVVVKRTKKIQWETVDGLRGFILEVFWALISMEFNDPEKCNATNADK